MKKEPEKKYGWGGARPNSGRRRKKGQNYTTLTARIPEEIVSAIKEAAEEEEISLSFKTADILAEWVAKQSEPKPQPEPDARTQALNRLADALEKIVERINPEED